MSLYTKRGGLKKLLKDFTKPEIAKLYIELLRKVENPFPNKQKKKKSKEESLCKTGEDTDTDSSIDDGKSDSSFLLNPTPSQVVKKSQVLDDEEKVEQYTDYERDKCDKIEFNSEILDSKYPSQSGEHGEKDENNTTENIEGYYTMKYRNNTQKKQDNPEHNPDKLDSNYLQQSGENNKINELTDKIDNLLYRLQDLEEKSKEFNQKQYILEKKVAANNQYTRINNIEISGIEEEIIQEDLQPTVIRILNQIDVPVNFNDIEACHRLYKKPTDKGPAKVIVRFFDRNYARTCHRNKKNLSYIDKYHCGIKKDSNIYIHENLCPTYKSIYETAYHLYKNEKIKNVWTFKGIVHIRMNDSDEHHKIVHFNELYEYFPDL